MSASSSDLLAGIYAGLAIELFPFRPVLDGPDGILSDLLHVDGQACPY